MYQEYTYGRLDVIMCIETAFGHLNGGTASLDQTETQHWVQELKLEHRDLDEVIDYLIQTGHPDRLKIQRLKKRKLRLRDMIDRLESELIPNLDA